MLFGTGFGTEVAVSLEEAADRAAAARFVVVLHHDGAKAVAYRPGPLPWPGGTAAHRAAAHRSRLKRKAGEHVEFAPFAVQAQKLDECRRVCSTQHRRQRLSDFGDGRRGGRVPAGAEARVGSHDAAVHAGKRAAGAATCARNAKEIIKKN